jgi:hypothetical protein
MQLTGKEETYAVLAYVFQHESTRSRPILTMVSLFNKRPPVFITLLTCRSNENGNHLTTSYRHGNKPDGN